MATKRRKRSPRLSLGIVRNAYKRPGMNAWTCPWCGDTYASFTRDLVSAWAIKHLNAHLRHSAVKAPSEAEA